MPDRASSWRRGYGKRKKANQSIYHTRRRSHSAAQTGGYLGVSTRPACCSQDARLSPGERNLPISLPPHLPTYLASGTAFMQHARSRRASRQDSGGLSRQPLRPDPGQRNQIQIQIPPIARGALSRSCDPDFGTAQSNATHWLAGGLPSWLPSWLVRLRLRPRSRPCFRGARASAGCRSRTWARVQVCQCE
jgi:hypothetical protein